MPGGNVGKHAEQLQLFGGIEGLVPQLDDVHTAGVGSIEELLEVPAVTARVGAKVKLGRGKIHTCNHNGKPRKELRARGTSACGSM